MKIVLFTLLVNGGVIPTANFKTLDECNWSPQMSSIVEQVEKTKQYNLVKKLTGNDHDGRGNFVQGGQCLAVYIESK